MNSLQQSSSEEFVASRISKSPTGRIRLLESIPERKNMQRALHFARYVDDCVIFVRSERGGKRVMNFPSIGLVFPWTRSCLISRTATYGPVRVVVWEGRPVRGVPIPMGLLRDQVLHEAHSWYFIPNRSCSYFKIAELQIQIY